MQQALVTERQSYECDTGLIEMEDLTERLKQLNSRTLELEGTKQGHQDMLDSTEARISRAAERLDGLRDEIKTLDGELQKSEAKDVAVCEAPPLHIVQMSELAQATYGFSATAIVGRGSFGTVYRAFWRGLPVAMKVMEKDSKQGTSEFLKEVTVLGTCRHIAIVPLLAISVEDGNLVLVYKLMTGGSLEDRLYFRATGTNPLCWRTRLTIVHDCLTGLEYLHAKRHLHRDIKAANVLLDDHCRASLGDVGLARELHSDASNKMSVHVVGTPGYLDPDFAISMTYTAKSDLFAMGIIMLELITRIPPMSAGRSILDRLGSFTKDGFSIEDRADPQANWPKTVVSKFLKIAQASSQVRRALRPNVNEVIDSLKRILDSSQI